MSKKIREEAERLSTCVSILSLARQAKITLILLDAVEERMCHAKAGEYIWWEQAIAKAEQV